VALVSLMYKGPNIDHGLGMVDIMHMLINLKVSPHGGLMDSHCFLCLAFNKKLKVILDVQNAEKHSTPCALLLFIAGMHREMRYAC
jgi:hypothetical protein